jgi:hypothetical protein
LRPGIPSLLAGAVFALVHLIIQLFALLQSYLSGMAHFDEPLSRQAAWESRFWEGVSAVVTFPLAPIWDHLPLAIRNLSVVEWGLLAGNSLLWALGLVILIRKAGSMLKARESEG